MCCTEVFLVDLSEKNFFTKNLREFPFVPIATMLHWGETTHFKNILTQIPESVFVL